MLNEEQIASLIEDGYLLIPRFVPLHLIDESLGAINKSLKEIDLSHEGRNYDFMSELGCSDVILDLYHRSRLAELAEYLLGKGEGHDVDRGQIALKFPNHGDGLAQQVAEQHWHLDGMYHSKNGGESSPINITLIAGVCLSDISGLNQGNFTLHPKGHVILSSYLNQHGIDSLVKKPIDIVLPPAKQIIWQKGDVVVFNHMLPHWNGAPNFTNRTRYAVFFRSNRRGRCAWVKEAITDPFYEWEGLKIMSNKQNEGQ